MKQRRDDLLTDQMADFGQMRQRPEQLANEKRILLEELEFTHLSRQDHRAFIAVLGIHQSQWNDFGMRLPSMQSM